MVYSTPEQLSFHPVAGHTVRADFEGGALSSDFGVLLLRGIDRQIGLTARLAAAIHDTRHPSYIDHPLRDLLAQHIYQIAAGYAHGNHTNDPTHGQQEFAFYNHYYKNYYYLPLLIFEGLSGALVTACLRPGTRPTGAENAMILVRLLAFLRRHWPRTHILVRGDSHFATPEVIEVLAHRHLIDFVFGLAGNPVLLRHAAPVIQEARRLHQQRTALAQAHHARPPASSRICT